LATTISGTVTSVIPIEYQDQHGAVMAAPTGDTVTVQNDNGEVIGASIEEDGLGNRSLVLTPAQPPQAGAQATITVSDTLAHGQTITTAPEVFEIEQAKPNGPNSIHLRLDMMTTRPLPSRGGARVTISRG
jgi:hypothetical protein